MKYDKMVLYNILLFKSQKTTGFVLSYEGRGGQQQG